jgi:glycosyltransferase involved in cell wall biosynthesis
MHIMLSLCRSELKAPLEITMLAPSIDPSCRRANLVAAIPRPLKKLCYALKIDCAVTEFQYLRKLRSFDAAYIWPKTSTQTIVRAKTIGKPVFLERINCSTSMARSILDDAYARLGITPQHGITPTMIREEAEETRHADYVMCPSPLVKASFLEAGVPAEKLLLSSYGWCINRFPTLLNQPPTLRSPAQPFTILFVGRVCVRKGAHLLMQAFIRSGVKGRVIFCGEMEPAIALACKEWLDRPDIIHLPYTSDITAVYREADLFAFPSLEEGSPQVTYEAMAHGLPVVVSPMGGGSIVRNAVDGWILPPYEEDAWVEAIRKLAASPELRSQFAQASWRRSHQFTYDQVAERRAQIMLAKLNPAADALEQSIAG